MPTVQTPEGFLAECHKRGIKLTAKDGTIKASGKPPANPEKFAAFLKAKKPELLALLQSSDASLSGQAPLTCGDLREVTGTSEALSEAPERLPISEFSEYPGPLTPPPFVGRGAAATPEERERFSAWARQEAELMPKEANPMQKAGANTSER